MMPSAGTTLTAIMAVTAAVTGQRLEHAIAEPVGDRPVAKLRTMSSLTS
jgi:hypothetical protein